MELQLDKKLKRALGASVVASLEMFAWLISRFSLVGNKPFFEPERFHWVKDLEQNWGQIRKELDELMKHRDKLPNFQDITPNLTRLTNDDKWKTYILHGFANKSERNCQKCPETARLVEKIPGMRTALFSILAPHKHIPEHRGVYKGLLRYHLGLIVPEPNTSCRIRVGKDIGYWQEGKSLMFDDTYPHEVWAEAESERVVLIVDVLRPLPFPISRLNEWIVHLISRSSYVQNGMRNEERWERAFHDNAKN